MWPTTTSGSLKTRQQSAQYFNTMKNSLNLDGIDFLIQETQDEKAYKSTKSSTVFELEARQKIFEDVMI